MGYAKGKLFGMVHSGQPWPLFHQIFKNINSNAELTFNDIRSIKMVSKTLCWSNTIIFPHTVCHNNFLMHIILFWIIFWMEKGLMLKSPHTTPQNNTTDGVQWWISLHVLVLWCFEATFPLIALESSLPWMLQWAHDICTVWALADSGQTLKVAHNWINKEITDPKHHVQMNLKMIHLNTK